MDLADVDLFDLDRFQRDEMWEVFDLLRREAPVFWHPDREGGFWSITRYHDVQVVNRDTETFSSERGGVFLQDLDEGDELDLRGVMMLTTDPPRHTRYRRLVNQGFTPRMVGLLEQYLRHRATLIVDNVIERGRVDFVEDVAAELPLQAIAEIMGVPQEERKKLFDWSNAMIGADDPNMSDQDAARAAAAELFVYANALGAERQARPQEDIITKLINAEIEGDRLSELEIDMFFMLLAVAGNETTRNATAHGMHALLTHPEQLERLQGDLSLLPTAVDEIVRWATPVMHFRRTTTRPVDLFGTEVPEGTKVVMWYLAANRDEEVFDEPYRFDVGRTPNEHVGFGGGGAHYCLGANLARMELRLIFEEVLTRMHDLALDGEVVRLRSNFIRGINQLPVRFRPGERVHPPVAAGA